MSSQDINVRQKPAVAATGSNTETILATKELTKNFGGLTAVDSVDFSITEGEIRCLIGPNGAGKSTLLELITGQLSPSEGDIYFDGEDLTGMETHDRIDTGLSVKFQSPHVYENLSVEENLQVPLQRTDRDIETVLAETLERIALREKANVRASELSHGEKQRLEIGMAVTLDPTLMLLDEPVAGMSVDETADVANLDPLAAQRRDDVPRRRTRHGVRPPNLRSGHRPQSGRDLPAGTDRGDRSRRGRPPDLPG